VVKNTLIINNDKAFTENINQPSTQKGVFCFPAAWKSSWLKERRILLWAGGLRSVWHFIQ